MNSTQYQETYRIASARLAGWDYATNAAYFVTICTQNHVHAFGEITGGQINLTALGEAAWDCWHAIPEHFPFVVLGEFVAMPNHVHGIVIINKSPRDVETQNLASLRSIAENPGRLSLNQFGPNRKIWPPSCADSKSA